MKAGAVCAWPVTPGAAEDVISIFQPRRVSRFPAHIVDAAGDFHRLLLGFSAHRTLMLRRLDRDRDPIGTKPLQRCGIVRRISHETAVIELRGLDFRPLDDDAADLSAL